MLRMYFLPLWPDLADGAAEDAVYGRYAMRKFMKMNFLEEDAPALPRFRHMPEEHGLREKILETVNKLMEEKGIMTRGEMVVDATIIEAPGSEYIGGPAWEWIEEGLKSKVKSKAEHMFGIIKGICGFRKVRYRGLKKNLGKLQMLFVSALFVEICADRMPGAESLRVKMEKVCPQAWEAGKRAGEGGYKPRQ
ncbi:MAG: hypothetical protein LBG27_01640 [Spirochaetaceae bacterium]|jgi:IS5 family transposase|nr:hypothetical protein [Spirochaetaceae bacterium]